MRDTVIWDGLVTNLTTTDGMHDLPFDLMFSWLLLWQLLFFLLIELEL
jgi:hypothetical protein